MARLVQADGKATVTQITHSAFGDHGINFPNWPLEAHLNIAQEEKTPEYSVLVVLSSNLNQDLASIVVVTLLL